MLIFQKSMNFWFFIGHSNINHIFFPIFSHWPYYKVDLLFHDCRKDNVNADICIIIKNNLHDLSRPKWKHLSVQEGQKAKTRSTHGTGLKVCTVQAFSKVRTVQVL